jgi:hypothetical protein
MMFLSYSGPNSGIDVDMDSGLYRHGVVVVINGTGKIDQK